MRPLALLLVLVSLLLAGCGGSETGGNVYTGNFTGTWEDPKTQTDGTYDLNVSTEGRVFGTVHHNQLNKDGEVEGQIYNDGRYDFLMTFPGEAAIRQTGRLRFDSNGRLVNDGGDFEFILLREF